MNFVISNPAATLYISTSEIAKIAYDGDYSGWEKCMGVYWPNVTKSSTICIRTTDNRYIALTIIGY